MLEKSIIGRLKKIKTSWRQISPQKKNCKNGQITVGLLWEWASSRKGRNFILTEKKKNVILILKKPRQSFKNNIRISWGKSPSFSRVELILKKGEYKPYETIVRITSESYENNIRIFRGKHHFFKKKKKADWSKSQCNVRSSTTGHLQEKKPNN